MTTQQDSIVRAMTNDGGFRLMAAVTTETCKEAIRVQKADGRIAELLANLVTAAILVRETMSPTHRAQCILVGRDGHGQIVADALPDGTARGLLRMSKNNPDFELGRGAMFQVMRGMPSGEPQRGITEVPDGATVADMVMVYMKVSEQIESMISLGVKTEDGEVVAAGGYVIQQLPELAPGPLLVMEERIKDFQDLQTMLVDGAAASPMKLTDELFYAMEYTKLDESTVRFECGCSELRVLTSLSILPRKDIEELVASAEPIELSCDYCGKDYRIGAEQLRSLLEQT